MLKEVRGAIYVEFLLVFMPVFLLFLAVVQLGFVYAARLVVQHAATRAARAAVVVLDDDPARYRGEARGRVELGGTANTPSPLEAFMSGAGLGGSAGDAAGGPRFRDIRSAAFVPLLAVGPTTSALDDAQSVGGAIGGRGERAAELTQLYNQAALAVTFPTEPGGSRFRTRFDADDLVTVRVTYVFHCSVPLVPELMCDGLAGLRTSLSPEERAQLDVSFLADLTHARFLVLRAEATLRNQGASYRYPGER